MMFLESKCHFLGGGLGVYGRDEVQNSARSSRIVVSFTGFHDTIEDGFSHRSLTMSASIFLPLVQNDKVPTTANDGEFHVSLGLLPVLRRYGLGA